MRSYTLISLLVMMLFTASTMSYAQDKAQRHTITQKYEPTDFENYYFSVFYYNQDHACNLSSYDMITSIPGVIKQFKMNPNGLSGAFVFHKEKKNRDRLYIYDLITIDTRLHVFDKDIDDISTICYSHDSRIFFLSDTNGIITSYDTKKYSFKDSLNIKLTAPHHMIASGNGYYLAAINGENNKVNILNIEENTIRRELSFNNKVTGINFSADNSMFAVSTEDGTIQIYNTRTFLTDNTIRNLGGAEGCQFHPEGKYIATISDTNTISIINTLDNKDIQKISYTDLPIAKARMFTHTDGKSHMIFTASNNIVIEEMSNLTPHYNQLLKTEVDSRMGEWLKMMDGETLGAYSERVNDNTRAEQIMLFEQEIATTMAQGTLEEAEITVGNYNLESNMLEIDFSTMTPIYLEVPSEEAEDFMNVDDLVFNNAKYALNSDDGFELVYADVLNNKSGKTYTFDNRQRQSLEYLKSDDSYVSLELVKQSNMDMMKLEDIKEEVVNVAKNENVISDNTEIKVDANVESDVDANGENIVNYNINFSYEVKPGFSATEDFAPGKYETEESGAATSMLKVVTKALEGDFAQYTKTGKKLRIDIIGSADSTPIRSVIAYNGVYGDLVNEPVYKNKTISAISVTKKNGITENEQLAFLRAWGVKNQLIDNISQISEMDTNINHHIEVLEGKGGEFRRITIKFTFIDAF